MASTNMKKSAGKATKKKRVSKNVSHGQVHIKTSFNNTIVTFTDAEGNALSWCSSGVQGLKGNKKGTPFAAQTSVERAAEVAKAHGIKTVEAYVKGPGGGREAAIRAIANCDIDVTLIKDVSPIAHNGCKPPKVRRV